MVLTSPLLETKVHVPRPRASVAFKGTPLDQLLQSNPHYLVGHRIQWSGTPYFSVTPRMSTSSCGRRRMGMSCVCPSPKSSRRTWESCERGSCCSWIRDEALGTRPDPCISERIQLEAVEFPALAAAIRSLPHQTDVWRRKFAQSAISAVERGSSAEVARIKDTVGQDQEPSLADVADLIASLDRAHAQISQRDDNLARTRSLVDLVGVIMMLLGAVASLILVRRWVAQPSDGLLATATEVEVGGDTAFASGARR